MGALQGMHSLHRGCSLGRVLSSLEAKEGSQQPDVAKMEQSLFMFFLNRKGER